MATTSTPSTSTAVAQQNTTSTPATPSTYPSFIPRNNATGKPDYAAVGLTGVNYNGTDAPPPGKPAPAIYSAAKAQDFTSNVMVPAMTDGLAGMAKQNADNAQNDLTRFLPGETAEQYNQRAQRVNAAKGGTPPPNGQSTTSQGGSTAAADAAATTIANTPEIGHQFIYDPTGQRLEVPIGTALPAGYSKTAPANPTQRGHTVTNQFNAANGMTYQQYSDGSYGIANADGTFANPVSVDEYQKAYDGSPTAVLSSIATGLASLKNGPLPLNAPQQAQIDALNANLGIAVKAQQQANEALTGGTTVAMNLYGMGESVSGLGLIKATVDSGIQKVFALQTQAADAIAKMEEQFNKDNFDQMYKFYTEYEASVKAISDNIQQMHTFAFQQKEHADQEADNLRTFNQTVQQDAIKNYQWGVTNAREERLARSTIATQAAERAKIASDIAKNNLDIKATQQMMAAANSLPGGTTLGANGQPDPAKQTAYLAQIAKANPGLALQIKAAAQYRLPLTSRFLSTKAGQVFAQEMLQYDPTWDATNYAAKQSLVTNFTSGKYSNTINALNTATAHIGTLATSISSLHNINFGPLNALKNYLGEKTGILPTSGSRLAIAAVTGELATAFKSTGATDAEIKALGTINENSSPAAVQSYITAASSLLAGKLGALNDTYTAGIGAPPPTPLLHPDASAALSTLKNQGFNIQVPGVPYTDVQAYRQHVPNADAKLDQARQNLLANKLPVNPENVLQAAQLNDDSVNQAPPADSSSDSYVPDAVRAALTSTGPVGQAASALF